MLRSLLPLVLLAAVPACDMVLTSSGDDGPGGGATPGDGDPAGTVTFYEQVAPILMRECVSCHVDGGIAPFALLDYDDAAAVGGLMQYATAMRIMPPWPVGNAGDCNTYRDARWLSDDDIETIGRWVDGGMAEGDPATAPPPPPRIGGLDRITETIDIGGDYTPNAALSDEYRCFLIDSPSATDAFLTAYHVRPGDPREVHHVALFALDSVADETAAEARDTGEPGRGYTCFGAAGVPARNIGAWAPGGGPVIHPAGSGIRVTGGRKLVLQVHYNMANGVFPDRTAIDLTIDGQVGTPAAIDALFNTDLSLPPRQSSVEVTSTQSIGGGGTLRIWGVFPHMHTRGTSIRVDAVGSDACVVNVPRWDFHWQSLYFFDTPITIAAGESLRIQCRYDTSEDTAVVTWGEGTDDEMCGVGLYVTQ